MTQTEITETHSSGILASFTAFGKDIKFTHTVFALPFAASALFIGEIPLPNLSQFLGLLGAMVGARTFAMGMNRYLDHKIDSENPRTNQRMIPAGRISPLQSLLWSMLSAAVFVGSSYSLSFLAGHLSFPLLIVLMSYSLFKRFSWLAHFYLGLCLGLAPIAVEFALTGGATGAVILVGVAIAMWTAGFDILYSLQDMQYDKNIGLHSVPSRFGAHKSLWISRGAFVSMITLLGIAGDTANLGPLYYGGIALIAVILAYEHWLVRDASVDGKSKNINSAFFTTNAWVSVVFLVFVILDKWLIG